MEGQQKNESKNECAKKVCRKTVAPLTLQYSLSTSEYPWDSKAKPLFVFFI